MTDIRRLFPPLDGDGGKGKEEGEKDGGGERKDGLRTLRSIGNLDRATLTLIGYKGGEQTSQINQDRSFVVSPVDPSTRLLGVFDGHGPSREYMSDHSVTQPPPASSPTVGKKLTGADDGQTTTEERNEAVKRMLLYTFLQTDA